MTLLARLAAAALLSIAALAGIAAPAAASPAEPPPLPLPGLPLPTLPDVDVCGSRTAPLPSFPDGGLIGGIAPAPAEPPTGDPFEPGGPTLVEVYGHGGKFSTYDLGCGQEVRIDAAEAKIGNRVATVGMGLARAMTAVLHRVAHHAYVPDWLDVLDVPVSEVSRALRDALYEPVGRIALLVCVVAVLLRLRRAQVTYAFTALFAVVMAATFIYTAAETPQKVTRIVDGLIPEAAATINGEMNAARGVGVSTDPASAAVAPLVALQYQQWTLGVLGCADCPASDRYGPDLYDAAHMTYTEAAEYAADPQGRGQEIVAAKAEQWDTVAGQVRENDPRAYASLTGANDDRGAAGWAAFLTVLAPALFLTLCSLLIVAAFLIWRTMVALGPAWLLAAFSPTGLTVLWGAGRTLAASLINSVVFVIVAGFEIAVVAALAGPASPLNWLWGAALVAAITCITWLATKPHRRLTNLVAPNPVAAAQDSAKGAWRTGKRLTGMAAASFAGNKVAMATERDDDPADDPERTGRRWHVPGSPQGPLRYAEPVQDRTLDDVYQEGYVRAPAPRPPSPGHADDLRPAYAPAPARTGEPLALPVGDAPGAYDVDDPRHARVNLDAAALPARQEQPALPPGSAPEVPLGLPSSARTADTEPAERYDPRGGRSEDLSEDPTARVVYLPEEPLEGRVVDDSDPDADVHVAPPTEGQAWVMRLDPETGEYRNEGSTWVIFDPDTGYRAGPDADVDVR